MDFIERLFGIAADNGNGLVELGYLAVGVLGLAVYLIRRYRRTGDPAQ